MLIHCHRWGLNLRPSARKRMPLTAWLSQTPVIPIICCCCFLLFVIPQLIFECSVSQIMRDPDTGNSKGYAFINFASFEASDAAIEAMNGQYLCNRPITISYAFKKDSKGERHGSAAGWRFINLIQYFLIAILHTCLL
jgi:hypothetical protein